MFKRYGEDRGGWLGAVISYYGFFSLLPALLAFVTIVYLVLGEQPTLLTNVLAALWPALPFVDAGTRDQVVPRSGSSWVLAIALLISIWGAVGVVREQRRQEPGRRELRAVPAKNSATLNRSTPRT